ncbi:MAG: FAD binding domain-containing protein [Candidatus Eremiobacteraeota bacterium]|nr:FAD binding domain-containing protein [Candidatus Eremiobacteraeota bacterium]
MLRLPPFTYEPAGSVDEAVGLLTKHGADCLPVSGGTDLYANMKQRLFTPKVLVGLSPIAALRYIAYNEITGLMVGALATLTEVAQSDVVRRYYPALGQAAVAVSTPQLRNMGTIGGNVCVDTRCNYYNQSYDWRKALGFCMKRDGTVCRVAPSSPKCVAANSSDCAPVLQAYGGSVHLAGPNGQRAVAVADFYRNDGIYAWARRADELVTAVSLPPPGRSARGAYRKLRLRHSFDFPILGVAVVAHVDDDGQCIAARIVLNAVSSRPLEATAAAAKLVGTKLEPDALDAAADAAFSTAKPLDNTSGSIPYRKRMARVFTRRALEDIASA